MAAILERLCGPPIRREGSHRTFVSPFNGQQFTYSYHDSRDIRGSQIRRILVSEVGLTPQQARKEAK